MRIKFGNGAEAEKNVFKGIADYPVGTIVEYAVKNYEDECKYFGIILGTTEDNCALYDIEDDCVYDDIENYSVVKVLDGYFTLKN